MDLSYQISSDGLLPLEAKKALFEQFTQRTAQKAWNQNKRQFEENRQEYIQKEFERMSRGERNHNSIYIQGDGNSGKSFLARLIAEQHDRLGAHTPSINKKRSDLGSGYKGQKTMIINEFEVKPLGAKIQSFNRFLEITINSTESILQRKWVGL